MTSVVFFARHKIKQNKAHTSANRQEFTVSEEQPLGKNYFSKVSSKNTSNGNVYNATHIYFS
jgi:hypothetical protein